MSIFLDSVDLIQAEDNYEYLENKYERKVAKLDGKEPIPECFEEMKPPVTHDYCHVCKVGYANYFRHLDSIGHWNFVRIRSKEYDEIDQWSDDLVMPPKITQFVKIVETINSQDMSFVEWSGTLATIPIEWQSERTPSLAAKEEELDVFSMERWSTFRMKWPRPFVRSMPHQLEDTDLNAERMQHFSNIVEVSNKTHESKIKLLNKSWLDFYFEPVMKEMDEEVKHTPVRKRNEKLLSKQILLTP